MRRGIHTWWSVALLAGVPGSGCGTAPVPLVSIQAGATAGAQDPVEPYTRERWPDELRDEGYVGAEACADCHGRNHETWFASYHRRMTQASSPAAILAPWEGRTPLDMGAAWKLERDGERFFATPTSAKGDRGGERMQVVLTTGSHHYQIYWLASQELGGLLGLPLVWDLAEGEWTPRRSMFLSPPQAETGFEFDRWQRSCIKCHTTNGTPEHPDAEAPRVADFGISCEACHGPGAEHVAFRRELEATGAAGADAPVEEDFIVDPSALDHERSAMACGQCHGISAFLSDEEKAAWRKDGYAFRPGDDLDATRALVHGRPEEDSPALGEILSQETYDELFWSDGEVRVSGREYNGLVKSPCFQRGEMDCVSCHEMHPSARDPRPLETWANDQLKRGGYGSGACLACHTEYEDEQALGAHTRHAPSSSGSACMNCHMPYTTYGLTKAIRSHTITSPDVGASVATGRPNACNQCHLDRSLGWTADQLADWFGHERPELSTDDEELAAVVVAALAGDAGQRALAAWALGWDPAREVSGTEWMPYLLSTLLVDSYDAVARVALRTARLDPRYAALSLDFTLRDARRAEPVANTVMADWLRDGHRATAAQATAVLVNEDGSLDQARIEALLLRRDEREVRLAE